ncbi:MAG: RNA methyltransferase [Clostridia bacterium]|nr:RNA methyltransferase [Clostridia bacterium]
MAELISTTRNKTYKYIRSLQQKKNRAALLRYTVEGIKSVSDALAAGAEIELVAMSESIKNSVSIECPGVRTVIVRDELFDGLCDTKTPQGIIAVIKMNKPEQYTCDMERPYIYCDGVSDPGNLGTIIRTADAAGFGGVLIGDNCAELYSPKTVRASMGSFFNIPLITDFTARQLKAEKERGFSLYCGALLRDSMDYREPDYTKPSILIVGNEANGASEEILSISEHIIIPIYGKAESLNAAVAASIMMYEIRRHRDGA